MRFEIGDSKSEISDCKRPHCPCGSGAMFGHYMGFPSQCFLAALRVPPARPSGPSGPGGRHAQGGENGDCHRW